MRRFLAIAAALLAVAVATSPAHAWQEVTDVRFIDRGRPQDLLLALDRQAEYLSRNPNAVAKVGPLRLTHAKLLEGVRALSKLVIESYEDPSFSDKVRAQFRVFRTSNPQKSGKAHFTAYYDPIINISLQRTPRFSEPIYRLPPEYVQGPSGCHRNLQQGRAPCHTRYEIEIGHALEGRGLEIAWTDDPVELHFLHIQGSGLARLPDGTFKILNFGGHNGFKFESATRLMMNDGLLSGHYIQAKDYMRTHLDVARKYLARNPRFIFFKLEDGVTRGAAAIPLTSGRSIATDPNQYASGTLGFIRYEAPLVNQAGDVTSTISTSRFVAVCDTGSAIVGPGRADLYVGAGPQAERLAGATNTFGELYILVPR